MPVFFDVWENMYGIQSFGVVLSILVRVSDFMIVLNSATNSLAYFGRKRWLERRLRLHMMKKEEKRARQLSVSGAERNDSRRQSSSQVAPRLTVSCTPSVCPPGMARGKTTQSCRSEDFSDSEVTGEKMKFIKYPLRLSKKEDSKCSNTSVSSIPTSPLVKEVMNGSHPVITQTYSNSLNGCHSPNQSRKTTDGRPLSALSGTSNPSSTSRHSPNPC
ncbi:unnamed protein product, partial [Mesorhabditis belari]|uniref:Uncharacterized protein n=1 Tax=Mesorhabditis belari TaxID=2138241 RepID=A0AAF3FI91_9BILA